MKVSLSAASGLSGESRTAPFRYGRQYRFVNMDNLWCDNKLYPLLQVKFHILTDDVKMGDLRNLGGSGSLYFAFGSLVMQDTPQQPLKDVYTTGEAADICK